MAKTKEFDIEISELRNRVWNIRYAEFVENFAGHSVLLMIEIPNSRKKEISFLFEIFRFLWIQNEKSGIFYAFSFSEDATERVKEDSSCDEEVRKMWIELVTRLPVGAKSRFFDILMKPWVFSSFQLWHCQSRSANRQGFLGFLLGQSLSLAIRVWDAVQSSQNQERGEKES